MAFGAGTTVSYVANQAGDRRNPIGEQTESIPLNVALLGQHSADGFTVAADDTSGTLLSYKDHLI